MAAQEKEDHVLHRRLGRPIRPRPHAIHDESALDSCTVRKRGEDLCRHSSVSSGPFESPKYPFAIDHSLAQQGESLFRANCTRCHGVYGEHWTYPNKIVPIDEIGTDPQRYLGIAGTFVRYYNQRWFGKEKPGWLVDEMQAKVTAGYQAPPLDGIWATAPYFHNGAAPTVYHVLNSSARPTRFTRSFGTDREAYDASLLGWKFTSVVDTPGDTSSALPRRVYDTTKPGRSNRGHTYGDHLSEADRMAVIEYLKTL